MPFRDVAAAALAEWRAAEQAMLLHVEGSPEWHAGATRAAAAKARYQRAIDDARAAHLPEPPPFAEAVS